MNRVTDGRACPVYVSHMPLKQRCAVEGWFQFTIAVSGSPLDVQYHLTRMPPDIVHLQSTLGIASDDGAARDDVIQQAKQVCSHQPS